MVKAMVGCNLVSAVAAIAILLTTVNQGDAQQGKYVNSCSARLVKLVDQGNKDGYNLQTDGFSIGGGWLKQGKDNWVTLVTTTLKSGQQYRLVAAGDMDAKDVDIQILNADGTVVASDTLTEPTATVNYTPGLTARYTIRIRLYASINSEPCVCMCILMTK